MALVAEVGVSFTRTPSINIFAKYGYILSPPYDGYFPDDDPDPEPKAFAYNIVPLPDRDGRHGKGNEIFFDANWRAYSKLINGFIEDRWIFNRGNMLVNSEYDEGQADNPLARARTISACNGESVFEYDKESATHVRIKAYPMNQNTNLLNKDIHNWYHHPELFYQACAIDADERIRLVGNAYYCYIPRVKRTELWIEKEKFVKFPHSPTGYKLYGCNVFTGDGIPLLTYPIGIRTFHTSWFRLPGSKGVVTPIGWR